MRGLVYTGNKTLSVKELKIPENSESELRIKVAYTGICGSDILLWNGGYPRVKPPLVIGHEFSGVIDKVSVNSQFKVGDRVVVEPLISCGTCSPCLVGEYNLCESLNLVGIDKDGGMAEYVCVDEKKVLKLPDKVSLKDAALIEPIAVTIHMLKKLQHVQGQKMLIIGAGPIGFLTATIARSMGAEVILSEVNAYRIQEAKDKGFTVINPFEENLIARVKELTQNAGADIVVEATGVPTSLSTCIEASKAKGVLIIAGMAKKPVTIDSYRIIFKELNIVGTRTYQLQDFLDAIQILENKTFDTNQFISRIVTLETVVKNGFEAIENGDSVMKVVVQLGQEV